MSVVVLVGAVLAVRSFLPAELGARGAAGRPRRGRRERRRDGGSARRFSLLDAWREPRTLLIGVTMLGFALAEGIAGDWLAVVGHRLPRRRGVGRRDDVLGLPRLA